MASHSTIKSLEESLSGRISGGPFSHSEGPPDRRWHAIFTVPNHEKRVSSQCDQKEIETFLPLYAVKRRWKNRRTVELQVPLFPCYSFVRINLQNRVRVLEVPGVISIVSAAGQLLPVPDEYIRALREGLLAGKIEPHANLEVGDLVRIKDGPFAGAQGILERHKNGLRVILKLEMLMRSVSLEVDASEIEAA